MNQESDYRAAVLESCRAVGIEFDSFHRVSGDVYRGMPRKRLFNTEDCVYVKVYPKERETAVREMSDLGTSIGHPPCRVVTGDPVCLVMAPAHGRPLSRLLPMIMIPGIWPVVRRKAYRIYEAVGENVGRLHARTSQTEGPVLNDEMIETAIDRVRFVDDKISFDADILRQALNRGRRVNTTHSLTFGDRSPHNIYVDGTTISLIDCTCKYRSGVIDHASTILGIRLMTYRLPFARRSISTELEHAYWTGYARLGLEDTMKYEAWAIRYIALCLQMLAYYRSDRPTGASKILRFVDPPNIHSEIELILKNLFAHS